MWNALPYRQYFFYWDKELASLYKCRIARPPCISVGSSSPCIRVPLLVIPVYGRDHQISLYTSRREKYLSPVYGRDQSSPFMAVDWLYAIALSEASIGQNEFTFVLPCQGASGLVAIWLSVVNIRRAATRCFGDCEWWIIVRTMWGGLQSLLSALDNQASSALIEKLDYFFDVFLSTNWKFCEISTLSKDIKPAVVPHQDLRVVSRHHWKNSDRSVLHQLVIYERWTEWIQRVWLIRSPVSFQL